MRVVHLLPMLAIAACSGASRPSTREVAPTAHTDCYAGVSTGMGQSSHTIARRIVDPATRTITEDVSHDSAGAHGAKSFHVVMTVDGDHFTMTESSGAFTGTGTLVGEPWQWTSWSSVSQIANTSITVESHDELTSTGLKAEKRIKQDGKVVATTVDNLRAFECAQWEDAKTALTTPVLDGRLCERACRNFATLKFWEHADVEISAKAEADRTAARAAMAEELAAKVAAGIDSCTTSCLASNNAKQAACWADATAVAQLAACDDGN